MHFCELLRYSVPLTSVRFLPLPCLPSAAGYPVHHASTRANARRCALSGPSSLQLVHRCTLWPRKEDTLFAAAVTRVTTMGGVPSVLLCLWCRGGCSTATVAAALTFFPPSPPCYTVSPLGILAAAWQPSARPRDWRSDVMMKHLNRDSSCKEQRVRQAIKAWLSS